MTRKSITPNYIVQIFSCAAIFVLCDEVNKKYVGSDLSITLYTILNRPSLDLAFIYEKSINDLYVNMLQPRHHAASLFAVKCGVYNSVLCKAPPRVSLAQFKKRVHIIAVIENLRVLFVPWTSKFLEYTYLSTTKRSK